VPALSASPIGAALGSFSDLPAGDPAAAGILAQAARVSLRAAFRQLRPRAFLLSPPAAAAGAAAA
jgi:hypothetical protein